MAYDLAIVGAGIVGLAHAVAALRRGLKVVVLDREARPIGASIRNFGFVTVTGQRRGDTWRRAKRSAEVWAELAPRAGIAIEQRGLWVLARRPESVAVLEAFKATEMGEACELFSAAQARSQLNGLQPDQLSAALHSTADVRVESKEALPRLIALLEGEGVKFKFGVAVHGVDPPRLETARGPVVAEAAIVCPGDDLSSLFPEIYERRSVTRCILQMLRLAPPATRLPAPVMSDLSLVRYRGYADLPESAALLARLELEQADCLKHGIHLIVAQSADGSLVVGDSHHYASSPDPFADSDVEDLILQETRAVLGAAPPVRSRWTGTYASAAQDMFCEAPCNKVRLVVVTSGTGASTAFAIAEETMDGLFGAAAPRPFP